MPALSVTCPSCQAVLKLPENFPPGARARCTKCSTPITLPSATAKANTQSAIKGDGSRLEATEAPSDERGDESSYLEAPKGSDELGRMGSYRILSKLGEGGMGMVYEAEDTRLRRKVALKVMLPKHAANPTAKARFLREARAQAAVEHDHVASIHIVGDDQAVPYIAMPLLKGQTLQAALKANPRPPVNEILRLGQEMAEGLAAAHAIGLIHRDIKPANIWLEGNKRKVKILDFGLARAMAGAEVDVDESEGPKTQQGAMLGTPAYMSPEQGRGEELDARSDLFSLGVVLYEMATGERPFKGKDVWGILTSLAVDNPAAPHTKNPAIPESLSTFILKILAKSPAERPQSGEEIAETLRQIDERARALPVLSAPAVMMNDPWDNIDATDSGFSRAAPSGSQGSASDTEASAAPRSSKKPLLIGLGSLVAVLVLGVIVIKVTNKDGSVTELKVPDGSKVEVTQGGKTRVVANPAPKEAGKPKDPVPPTSTAALLSPGIDLLARVDLSKDVINGEWIQNGVNLDGQGGPPGGGKNNALVAIPYTPPEEYDLLFEFTRLTGNRGFGIYLPCQGNFLRAVVTQASMGVEARGVSLPKQGTPFRKRFAARVEVRRDRVALYLDGEKVDERPLNGDFGDFRPPKAVANVNSFVLDVAEQAEVTFHSLRVVEVTGRGTLARPDESPDASDAKKLQAEWAAKLKLPVESTSSSGIAMVVIPPGEGVEKPFLMGKYEVTQGEWEKEMGYNPSLFKLGIAKLVGQDASRFPVESVNWFDSVEFCNKLSEKEGLKPYYELTVTERKGPSIEQAEVKIVGGNGYHLPTDAEWTWACAAGAKTKFHFGSRDEDLPEYAWFDQNSGGRTHAVGEKKPNAFGLYDIHGNVREWNEEMLRKVDTGDPERVSRGGFWNYPAANCAVSYRNRNGPANRHINLGLRLARVPAGEMSVPGPDATDAKKFQTEWAVKLKLPVESTSATGIAMVVIPPGEGVEKPFLIGKYEVTQGEWEKVMGYNPSEFGPKNAKLVGQDASKFPVEKVNWFDCVEFCNKLSEKEGLKPYYVLKVTQRGGNDNKQIEDAEAKILGGNGYHLPTDTEWTWACAAGAKTKFHFGNEESMLKDYGWYRDNSDERTHAVGGKKPNAFGLYDIHGNVREWGEEMLTMADGAPERVTRGGPWINPAASCAVSTRHRHAPAHRNHHLGLRLVRVP